MKNLVVIAVVTLVSGTAGLLMTTPHYPGNANGRKEIYSPIRYKGNRVDSLQAEIHNDSVLYCKARAREDSLRNIPKFALNR